MSEFYRVCKKADISDPGSGVFEVEDRFIVLIHLDGEFYALDDACTHDGGPLGGGLLEGYQIICPRHGARFDVRTGQALSMPAVHATAAHEVKVEGKTSSRAARAASSNSSLRKDLAMRSTRNPCFLAFICSFGSACIEQWSERTFGQQATIISS